MYTLSCKMLLSLCSIFQYLSNQYVIRKNLFLLYERPSQNRFSDVHISPFCIVVTADIIMNVYLLLPLEEP